jgi:hypothetical protein
MTPRPLTAIEIDTIRVALTLLLEAPADDPLLTHARALTEVTAIARDTLIEQLLGELEGGAVTVRRAEP